MPVPSQQQLAVLDWLRRNPGIWLSERGRFSHGWRDEKARERMLAVAVDLFGLSGLSESHAGRTANEGTPKCGKVTMRALIRHGLVEPVETPGYRGKNYGLGTVGRETLLRWSRRLEGFTPKLMNDCTSRPIRPGRSVLKRYGGKAAAESYLEWHRRQEAYHRGIAERIEESLRIEVEAVTGEQEEWKTMAAERLAKKTTGS